MDVPKKMIGAVLAGAVAISFISAAYAAQPTHVTRKWVKCYGINACRGKSSCRITTSTCKALNHGKGMNSCKGKGFMFKTPKECKRLGGTTPETPDALK